MNSFIFELVCWFLKKGRYIEVKEILFKVVLLNGVEMLDELIYLLKEECFGDI